MARRASPSGGSANFDALLTVLDGAQGERVPELADDLGKPAVEAWATDVVVTRREIALARQRLRTWSAERRVELPAERQPAAARVIDGVREVRDELERVTTAAAPPAPGAEPAGARIEANGGAILCVSRSS